MPKVELCGGSNNGRIITVLHGSSVRVKKRGVPNSFDVNGEVVPSSQLYEIYRRPIAHAMSEHVEQWYLDGQEQL